MREKTPPRRLYPDSLQLRQPLHTAVTDAPVISQPSQWNPRFPGDSGKRVSLSLVRFRGQLPLSNCTFSSAEKKAASERLLAESAAFLSLSHTIATKSDQC